MAIKDEEKGEKKEVIILVSPICKSSLDSAVFVRRWAKESGFNFREVSVLEPEGQEYVLEFGIRRVPALIINGKLVSEGKIEIPGVERVEN